MPNPKLETYKNKATGTVYDYTDAAAQAALANILDGTDIDSFGDVETDLATKVDKVEGKGLSTNDYDDTAKAVVTTAQDNIIANTKLIKDTVGWSGKNKCPNDLVSHNANNTTITVNANKSVSLTTGSGGATADTWLTVHTFNPNELTAGNYKLSGCPSGGSNQKYEILFREDPAVSGGVSKEDFGNGASFTISDISKTYKLFIGLKRGQTASNLTFKPMVRDANILDDTYEPYFGSTAFPRSEQAVMGAVNLCENKATTQTLENATFTVNANKTITVNRSQTGGQAQLSINSALTLKAGTYKLCGFPKLGEDGIGQLHLYKDGYVATDTGDGDVFTLANDTTVIVVLRLNNTKLATNLVVKPMITLDTNATYSDYVPYAMTNKELTEQLNAIFAESLNDGTTFNIPYKRKSDGRNTSGLIVMSGGLYHYFLRPTDQSNTVDVNKILDVNSSRSATGSFANDILTITFNATVPGGITLLTGNKA